MDQVMVNADERMDTYYTYNIYCVGEGVPKLILQWETTNSWR